MFNRVFSNETSADAIRIYCPRDSTQTRGRHFIRLIASIMLWTYKVWLENISLDTCGWFLWPCFMLTICRPSLPHPLAREPFWFFYPNSWETFWNDWNTEKKNRFFLRYCENSLKIDYILNTKMTITWKKNQKNLKFDFSFVSEHSEYFM